MSKSYKILLGIMVLLLGIFIVMEASRPEPLDWTPTYSVKDKIPLGTYVFFHSLENKAPNLKKIDQPPFNFLQDSTLHGTYFFVNNALGFNKAEVNKMLGWVKKGNTLFVSTNYISKLILDTLNLTRGRKLRRKSLVNYPQYNFSNPSLKADSAYLFKHNAGLGFFEDIDTLKQTVLGVARLKTDSTKTQKNEINFLEAPFGKGKIFMHSSPQVFSNFFMLSKHNYDYAENLLAYINVKGNVFYDVYYDHGKVIHTSPLYVFLNNKYLKWAYYFVLIGTIFFILFEGKRKQKAIKAVPPLKNKTYDYTRTIAGMYLEKKDHTSIAHKKIIQFLEFVRKELRTDVQKIDSELIKRLRQLTENSEEDIKALFDEIQRLQSSEHISKQELLDLNQGIINFKNNL